MKKYTKIIPFVALVVLGLLIGLWLKPATSNLGGVGINNPQFAVASSTSFSLSTTQRLLATSSLRVAATIQPLNCPTNGGVHLNAQNDAVATVSTGPVAFASTTFAFGSFPEANPVPTGAVQGIAVTGTCTKVLVTEWRSIR